MSTLSRSPIPTNNHLLKPNSLKQRLISVELRKKRNQQKTSYDKIAKPLKQLNPDRVVRIQSPFEFDRVGTTVKLCVLNHVPTLSAMGKETSDGTDVTYYQFLKSHQLLPIQVFKKVFSSAQVTKPILSLTQSIHSQL